MEKTQIGIGRIIITGASGSMGAAATRTLAGQGHAVLMACRAPAKAAAVRDRILAELPDAQITVRQLDLASPASVRAFAEGLDAGPYTALFNNAGVISRGYSLTPEGVENTFAVNYFGPALLMQLLAPHLTEDAHIVNMVSLTCRYVSITEASLHPAEKDFSQLGTYARAKLAMMHLSQEFARRHPGLRINFADPGIVNSNMISMGRWFDPLADVLFRPFCKSPQKGVQPALAALSYPEGGKYFVGRKVMDIPDRFKDPELELRLWKETFNDLNK